MSEGSGHNPSEKKAEPVYIDAELKRKLSIIAARTRLSMKELAEAMIGYALRNRELLRRIVEDLGGVLEEDEYES